MKIALKYHTGSFFIGPALILLWPIKKLASHAKQKLLKADKKTKSFKFWMAFWTCGLCWFEWRLKYITNHIYFQVFNIFMVIIINLYLRLHYLEMIIGNLVSEFFIYTCAMN